MTQVYTSTNQANVQAASDKQYVNMLRQRAIEYGGTLYLNPPSLGKIVASEKTDTELLTVPLLGFTRGNLNIQEGFTGFSFSSVKERNDVPGEFWCRIHPDANMRNGVIDVIEKTFQESWYPPTIPDLS